MTRHDAKNMTQSDARKRFVRILVRAAVAGGGPTQPKNGVLGGAGGQPKTFFLFFEKLVLKS